SSTNSCTKDCYWGTARGRTILKRSTYARIFAPSCLGRLMYSNRSARRFPGIRRTDRLRKEPKDQRIHPPSFATKSRLRTADSLLRIGTLTAIADRRLSEDWGTNCELRTGRSP